MSFVNYVKKTPVTQILVDWKEYKKCKKNLHSCTDDMNYYYDMVQTKGHANNDRCCLETVQTGKQPMTNYCKKFFNHNCDSSCPVAWIHNRYWELVEQRDEASLKFFTFWHNKFQNVK
ncbi:MAG: hypothetical protein E7011_03690 [Alphaproteobacteria bacterium]|nr:hypothetical protein [Alphaproteobacteria bacterium]